MSLWVAGVVAAGLILFFARARGKYLALPELPQQDFREPAQDILVVVPARDEEPNIARVVSSFPLGWVLVVDDGSEDRTTPIARANSAEAIHAPHLENGHIGKPAACAAAAEATRSDWILFVDADTWYAPEFLCSLLDYADGEQLDMVSVFPHPAEGPARETILRPYALALYFCGINMRAVADPKATDALAHGQCMLFRRSFYDFIGGHRAVIKSVIEDVELAHAAKRHRGKTRVLRAPKMAFARPEPSLGDLWHGLSRFAFKSLESNRRAGRKVLLASLFAAAWLPALGFLVWEQQWIAAAAFAALPAFVFASWYGGVLEGLLAPVAIYLFLPILLRGLLRALTGRKLLWKGRRV